MFRKKLNHIFHNFAETDNGKTANQIPYSFSDRKLQEATEAAIKKVREMSPEEREAERRERRKYTREPKYIDDFIWGIEHGLALDGVIDWRGCHIDENWEKYKTEVGYYERHPERKEESEAYTRMMIVLFGDKSE